MRQEVHERAETYLRLLAEAALRARSTGADSGADSETGAGTGAAAAERVSRAADILIGAGVVEELLAAEIIVMLGTALRIRGVEWRPAPRGVRRLAAGTLPHQPAPQPAAPAPWRVIPARAAGSEPAPHAPESRVMAIIVTADAMIAPAMLRFPEQPAAPGDAVNPQAAPSFADLTATDDAGTGYTISFIDSQWAGGTWTGTLMLRPAPPSHARALTIASLNGVILRTPLTTAPQPGPATCEVTDATDSPGERMLTRRAESLITAFALGGRRASPGSSLAKAAVTLSGATGVTEAEVRRTLEAAGALSPLSPVPGQLAALGEWVAAAGAPGSARAALPTRWTTVLAHYARRHPPPAVSPAPSGEMGAIAAVLPPVDGVRLVIAGVRISSQGTLMHLAARGLRAFSHAPSASPAAPAAAAHDTGLSWWVRDESGGWHLGVVHSWHAVGHDTTLRLLLLPPLPPGAPGTRGTLTIEVTGTWQRLTADVPVHW